MSISSDFNPLDILRITSSDTYEKKKSHDEESYQKRTSDYAASDAMDYSGTIYQLAANKAKTQENTVPLTVTLNDFTELLKGKNNLVSNGSLFEEVSAISVENDMQDYGFFQKLFNGKKCDNIFKTEEARLCAKDVGWIGFLVKE